MKFIISLEFDIEPAKIPEILRSVEDVAYDLGCVQVMTYQDSGRCINVDGQTVRRKGNGETD